MIEIISNLTGQLEEMQRLLMGHYLLIVKQEIGLSAKQYKVQTLGESQTYENFEIVVSDNEGGFSTERLQIEVIGKNDKLNS